MTKLSWSGEQVADELVGALVVAAGLCRHRPEEADAVLDRAVGRLDGDAAALLEQLHARWTARTDERRVS